MRQGMKWMVSREFMHTQMQYHKKENEVIPWGYGPAWRDFNRQVIICYPLGLHWIMRWGRDLRHWVMGAGFPGYTDRITQVRFQQGFNRGFDSGVVVGIEREKQRLSDALGTHIEERRHTRSS